MIINIIISKLIILLIGSYGLGQVASLENENKMPAFEAGGSWRFRESEIEHWISTQSAKMLDDKGSEDEKSE